MNTVLPSSSTNERIIWRNSAIPAGSSPFDGSSRIRSSGSVRRLRATPSRWRIPSEYFFTAVPAAADEVDTLERGVDPAEGLAADEARRDLQVPPPREIRIEPRLLDDRRRHRRAPRGRPAELPGPAPRSSPR